MRERSWSGSVSSARCTRHDSHSLSATSGGPGRRSRPRGVVDCRIGPTAEPVDDRVPGDRVEPRRRCTPRGVVAARRPPDARERVLGDVLRAAAVADPPQGDAEDGPRVASVKLLERTAVAAGDQTDELGVRTRVCGHDADARDSVARGQVHTSAAAASTSGNTVGEARRFHERRPMSRGRRGVAPLRRPCATSPNGRHRTSPRRRSSRRRSTTPRGSRVVGSGSSGSRRAPRRRRRGSASCSPSPASPGWGWR